ASTSFGSKPAEALALRALINRPLSTWTCSPASNWWRRTKCPISCASEKRWRVFECPLCIPIAILGPLVTKELKRRTRGLHTPLAHREHEQLSQRRLAPS